MNPHQHLPDSRVTVPGLPDGLSFSVAEGRQAGFSESDLRSSAFTRPYYGVRVPSEHAGKSLLDRCRALLPRLRPEEFFSHQTALALWGAPVPEEQLDAVLLTPHVSVAAPHRATRVEGVIGHQLVTTRVRVMRRSGLPVCDPESAWLHSARSLDVRSLVIAGDALITRPRFRDEPPGRAISSTRDLGLRVFSDPGRGRRFARLALARIRDGADSPMETRLRLLLSDHGLPEPTLQFPLRDERGGWIGRFDLAYPGQRVLVEYDGEQHRTDRDQYRKDLGRLDQARSAGFTVIRVHAEGVFHSPSVTAARVRAALRLPEPTVRLVTERVGLAEHETRAPSGGVL